MKQLEALDAVFLSMETPASPSHIGGVSILDPSTSNAPFDFDQFVAFVGERIRMTPRFGWKLREFPFGLDLPYWVEDENFRVENHVRRAALPAPGGQNELAEWIGLMYAKPLDRDRPLWEMFVVEGLQGGRVAMLWKIHHCLMDGVSGAGLIEVLCDLEPEPAARPLVESDEEPVGSDGSWFEFASRCVRNAVQRPVSAGRHAFRFGAAAVESARAGDLAPDANAPRLSFNGAISPRRAVAWSSVSLDEVKSLKDHFGVTVNDVVLALTGSALRRYLMQRDELPDEPLTAMVPVSTRVEGDDSLGNQISQVSLPWATHLTDPIERLMTIHEAATHAKQTATSTGANLMAALGESLPPALIGLVIRAAAAAPDQTPLPGNAVVSNVRSTTFPLYIAGARVERILPISVLAPSQGLNFTVVSYCGELHFGLTVDPELVPNAWMIADGIPKALTELWEASPKSLRD